MPTERLLTDDAISWNWVRVFNTYVTWIAVKLISGYLIRAFAPCYLMAIHIAFEKSTDTLLKKLVSILAGPYVHTELIVSQRAAMPVHTAYSAYTSCNFSRTFQRDFSFNDSCHDFLHIPVSDEELLKISETCEACAESRIPYNLHDMILCQMPLRNPKENDLFHTKALFCSQATVLILRSCMSDDNPLKDILSSINSRTVTPSKLFDVLSPLCNQKCHNQVLS